MLILTHVLDIVQAFCDLIKTCTYNKLLQIIFFFNVIYFKKIFFKNIQHKILSYCLLYS